MHTADTCTGTSLSRRPALLIVALLLFCDALATPLPQSKIQVGGAEFELVTIPPGKFMMGSNSGPGDERPVHKVTINHNLEIGKTEVTVAQFQAFVEATGYKTEAETGRGAWHCPCPDKLGSSPDLSWKNPGFDQGANHPAACVTYRDANAFCRWLSQQTGQHFRLPTEAEWEYACRAGTTGDYAGDVRQMAWFDMTSQGQTKPVAQKNPNPWGLYDMQGNVWEWCQDIYRWHYANAPSDGSANTNTDLPTEAASRRVLRGGAWCRPGTSCRSSFRYPAHPAFRECGSGFRIVRCKKAPVTKADVTAVPAKKSRKPAGHNGKQPSALTLAVDGIEFDFVRIEAGTFTMGSPNVYVDVANMTYELPAHKVTIDYSYYMQTTEVTLEQFDLFAEATGYVTDAEKKGWALHGDKGWRHEILSDWRFCGFTQTEAEPVTHISWYDAIAFCRWLSEKTGRDIRLPTEAEWEYACRAATTGDYAGTLDKMAWCRWNSVDRTHPVARKKPNAWGLYDMHGNVWEWVQDLWHDDCNGAPTDGSAWLEAGHGGYVGVTRGGSFAAPPWLCRSYSRMWTLLDYMVNRNNGFRLTTSAD